MVVLPLHLLHHRPVGSARPQRSEAEHQLLVLALVLAEAGSDHWLNLAVAEDSVLLQHPHLRREGLEALEEWEVVEDLDPQRQLPEGSAVHLGLLGAKSLINIM